MPISEGEKQRIIDRMPKGLMPLLGDIAKFVMVIQPKNVHLYVAQKLEERLEDRCRRELEEGPETGTGVQVDDYYMDVAETVSQQVVCEEAEGGDFPHPDLHKTSSVTNLSEELDDLASEEPEPEESPKRKKLYRRASEEPARPEEVGPAVSPPPQCSCNPGPVTRYTQTEDEVITYLDSRPISFWLLQQDEPDVSEGPSAQSIGAGTSSSEGEPPTREQWTQVPRDQGSQTPRETGVQADVESEVESASSKQDSHVEEAPSAEDNHVETQTPYGVASQANEEKIEIEGVIESQIEVDEGSTDPESVIDEEVPGVETQTPIAQGSQTPGKFGSRTPSKTSNDAASQTGSPRSSRAPSQAGSKTSTRGSKTPSAAGSRTSTRGGSKTPSEVGSKTSTREGSKTPSDVASDTLTSKGSQTDLEPGDSDQFLHVETQTPIHRGMQTPRQTGVQVDRDVDSDAEGVIGEVVSQEQVQSGAEEEEEEMEEDEGPPADEHISTIGVQVLDGADVVEGTWHTGVNPKEDPSYVDLA